MRIAVLGGGVGSMTAAYWLTNPGPDGVVPDHDLTVYQLGWRLGGKGASGRNADMGNRIEEHGLHIWMGFYANAFRMMRAVYGELNRPADVPLATWKDAFKPQTVITMMDTDANGQWIQNEWVVATPMMPGEPGDQTGFGDPCDYHFNIIDWLEERIEGFFEGRDHHGSPPHEHSEEHTLHLEAIHAALHEASAHAGEPKERGKRKPKKEHHHLMLQLALEGVQKLIGIGFKLEGKCVELHRVLLLADIGVASMIGAIKDLCGKPWDAIDDQEWRAWMIKHGLHKETQWCSVVRAMYDIVFGYRDGDAIPNKADLAAGTTTQTMLRVYFDYYESVLLKMQAGMGDTIFAPIYEVLKKRGVKFKYFHRLRDVIPSEDGTVIDALKIGVQATPKSGDYDPLVVIKGLPCWPSQPLFDQLVQGDELQAKNIDLESYDANWPDVEELELKRGTDFDHVVFGLSLGAVPRVCSGLLKQKEPWRNMVDKVKVIRTQASQLWFDRNVADLGWTCALNGRCYGERAVFGTFVEPMDTWADMSQLLPLETWNVPVGNVAYFCGAMKDTDPATIDVPREITRSLLEDQMGLVWTYAAPRKGKFHYDWLVVDNPEGVSDEERYRRQYFRVNTEPTELYVLSVAGSTKCRLDPADTGYSNLSLAGDWVYNGFPIGCVESGVLGGMKGVRRFCPGMEIVE
ncbi:MAG TPA: NAD(P)-binding protein [Thermoanaerobaculia bacterium]|jgi:uncharacterized protein with NAD-binding domain and iron-sulfur cluster|nr:NAD(P)-binding protein [Thermoanaerobaculia bacterium]